MSTPVIDQLTAYEHGDLTNRECLDLFADLIESGLAWDLQNPSYGRSADHLIAEGWISPDGVVAPDADQRLDCVQEA